jgi:SlyX protein
MSTTLEDRLTELEMRCAFLDDTVQSLSSTVAVHDRQLRQTLAEVEQLRSALGAVKTALDHDVRDEPKPPHY